jgi:hypothetical protein
MKPSETPVHMILEARAALARALAADKGNILVEPLREDIISYLVSGDIPSRHFGYRPPSDSFGPPAASLLLWCRHLSHVTVGYLSENAEGYVRTRIKELNQKLDKYERRHLSQ